MFTKIHTKQYSYEYKKGFTIIEALVAIFILTVSVTALMSVVTQGIFNSSYIKNKAVAISLAQEGMELVRNIQDSALLSNEYVDFDSLASDVFSPCVSNDGVCTIDPLSLEVASCQDECPLRLSDTGYFNYTYGEVSPFTRTITMNSDTVDSGTVEVIVSWVQGNTPREVAYQSNLFLWIE